MKYAVNGKSYFFKINIFYIIFITDISGNGHVEALHIRNASLDILNVEDWRKLKYLKYMTITDGQINSVVGEFAKHTTVSCLNLSSNGIVNFENRSLVNLYNLTFLDLSHNNLSAVPRFKKDGNVTLDISGRNLFHCHFVIYAT
jgi:Leucine-rich repeat (LRR) protein